MHISLFAINKLIAWFDWASATGRTRKIMDRQGIHLYLERLHLHPRWLSLWLFRINVHKFHRSDDPYDGLHDHPWPYITHILRGGYVEHMPDGAHRRKVGDTVIARADRLHRVELPKRMNWLPMQDGTSEYPLREEVPAYTLFIMGPSWRPRPWGFLVDGVWYPWQEWISRRSQLQGGY